MSRWIVEIIKHNTSRRLRLNRHAETNSVLCFVEHIYAYANLAECVAARGQNVSNVNTIRTVKRYTGGNGKSKKKKKL